MKAKKTILMCNTNFFEAHIWLDFLTEQFKSLSSRRSVELGSFLEILK